MDGVDLNALDELIRDLPDSLMFCGHQAGDATVNNKIRSSPKYSDLNLLLEGVMVENQFTLEKSAYVIKRAEEARNTPGKTHEERMEILNEPDLVRFRQLQVLSSRGNRQFFVISKNHAAIPPWKWRAKGRMENLCKSWNADLFQVKLNVGKTEEEFRKISIENHQFPCIPLPTATFNEPNCPTAWYLATRWLFVLSQDNNEEIEPLSEAELERAHDQQWEEKSTIIALRVFSSLGIDPTQEQLNYMTQFIVAMRQNEHFVQLMIARAACFAIEHYYTNGLATSMGSE